MVTVLGIIIVARQMPNTLPEPLKGSFANTNAAMAEDATSATVQPTASRRLLRLARAKEKPCMLNTRS